MLSCVIALGAFSRCIGPCLITKGCLPLSSWVTEYFGLQFVLCFYFLLADNKILSGPPLGIYRFCYINVLVINRVVEASLGYFMSPLMSIALARLFIGERINGTQAIAVALASCGVLWLAILGG